MTLSPMLDVAIIGAGPAGLSAAAALLRCNLALGVQVSPTFCMVARCCVLSSCPATGHRRHASDACCLSNHVMFVCKLDSISRHYRCLIMSRSFTFAVRGWESG